MLKPSLPLPEPKGHYGEELSNDRSPGGLPISLILCYKGLEVDSKFQVIP